VTSKYALIECDITTMGCEMTYLCDGKEEAIEWYHEKLIREKSLKRDPARFWIHAEVDWLQYAGIIAEEGEG
jgi:hypothetical protein